ncbi:MAG: hypothetical protein QM803_11775 [Rhodocyclaceae bacterium]
MAQPQHPYVVTGDSSDSARDSPKLLHECHQDVDNPQPPKPEIRNAQDDIESGRKDSDLRGMRGLDKPQP